MPCLRAPNTASSEAEPKSQRGVCEAMIRWDQQRAIQQMVRASEWEHIVEFLSVAPTAKADEAIRKSHEDGRRSSKPEAWWRKFQWDEGTYSVGRGNEEGKRAAALPQTTWEAPPPPPPKAALPPNILQPPPPPPFAPTAHQAASSWCWGIEKHEDGQEEQSDIEFFLSTQD